MGMTKVSKSGSAHEAARQILIVSRPSPSSSESGQPK
jgi:hypothetical protein